MWFASKATIISISLYKNLSKVVKKINHNQWVIKTSVSPAINIVVQSRNIHQIKQRKVKLSNNS